MLSRTIYWAVALLAATGLYACWCGAALTWDGAYQFCRCLIEQQPYVYGSRFHSGLLWLPFVGLSRWTQDGVALQFAFGLPFLLAPAAAVLVSWWVVRRDAPGLIVWAVFGVAIAPLPGQIFAINDSLFQQHLFWPVFLGLFVPLGRLKRAVLGALSLFQLSHPIGVLLLGLGVAAAMLLAWREPARRRRHLSNVLVLAVLAGVAVAKIVARPDRQAADEFHVLVALNRWSKGVYGAPLGGLRLFWAAGLLVFLRARLDGRRLPTASKLLAATALVAGVAGGAVWLAWAADERRWAFALDYRRWLVPLTLPFFVFCVWEGCRIPRRASARADDDVRSRGRICFILAMTFAAVLGVQSFLWRQLAARLVREADAYPAPVVPRSAVPWIEGTALQHWGTSSVLAALQGPTPRRMFLFDSAAGTALHADPPRVPIGPDDWGWVAPEPGPRGWFDYRPLLGRLRPADDVIPSAVRAEGADLRSTR